MRAGELNRRITLQIKTITYDTVNEPIETWTDFATVWAAVITTGGREFYAAQKLNAETSAVFKVPIPPASIRVCGYAGATDIPRSISVKTWTRARRSCR